ncbi:MAG: DNA polymerase III subunit delta [Lachnospiraceae bacterium]|nr:DNA polymerase III subunit delta [Lachnospiraceae bacterium]
MDSIRDDIKKGVFKRVYLIWGEEDYLRDHYKKALSDAVVPPGDTMNRSVFTGKEADEEKIMALSETLPFMSEKRLILVEDSGFFKNGAGDGFTEYLERIPEETVLVFSEGEVDRKRKLFKKVSKLEGSVECKKPEEKDLKIWIGSYLSKNGKKIRGSSVDFLISKAGTDMYLLKNEMDKLISYSGEREEVTLEDIREISSVNLQSSVFSMIDDIAAGRQKKALERYYEMLLLKEAPMRILYLLSREFNMLLLAKELSKERRGSREMAGAMKVPEFAVRKYVAAASRYTGKQLIAAVDDCLKTEDDVKKGKITDRLGTELLIVKYSGFNDDGGSHA